MKKIDAEGESAPRSSHTKWWEYGGHHVWAMH